MSCFKGNYCNSVICNYARLWHSPTTSPVICYHLSRAYSNASAGTLCDNFAVVLQPKRPFMLRTLPSRHCAELEELLPQALSNSTMVNGLECKLCNRGSKVSLLTSVGVCRLSGGTTRPDMCAVIYGLLMLFLLLLGWHSDLTHLLLDAGVIRD